MSGPSCRSGCLHYQRQVISRQAERESYRGSLSVRYLSLKTRQGWEGTAYAKIATLQGCVTNTSNQLVFGHTDLLSGNVIIEPHSTQDRDSKVETVSFIDYEYAVPCPAAFDIANHFAEWGGFDCDYNNLPTRSVRRAFIEEYISSCRSHTHLEEGDELVSRIFAEIDAFRGVPGLYWGIWALIQATISQIDFDYASYAEIRLGEYWEWRAEQDGSRAREGKEMPLRERRWAEE